MKYKINGVTMPVPTGYVMETNNLYGPNTGRDEAGFNHLDLVRSNVKKWNISHEKITRGEMDTLKNALNPLGFEFTGLHTNGVVTCNCYGTIKDLKCVYYENDTASGSYWDLSISIIEN